MNKRLVTSLLAVSSAALGSYYYGGYKERQKLHMSADELRQIGLLHKVRMEFFK